MSSATLGVTVRIMGRRRACSSASQARSAAPRKPASSRRAAGSSRGRRTAPRWRSRAWPTGSKSRLAGPGQPSAEDDRLRREDDRGPGERQRQRLGGFVPDPPCDRVAGDHPLGDLPGPGDRPPGDGRVAAGDRGGRGDRLDTSAPPAGARFPVAHVDMPDLTRIAAAGDQACPCDDDPGGDARADRDEDQVLEALGRPQGATPPGCRPGRRGRSRPAAWSPARPGT